MTPFKPQVIREIHAPVPANDPIRDAPPGCVRAPDPVSQYRGAPDAPPAARR